MHPYLINQALKNIAASHGVAFVDTTPAIAWAKEVADLYCILDGHLDGKDQTLIAPTIVGGTIADLAPSHDCASAR